MNKSFLWITFLVMMSAINYAKAQEIVYDDGLNGQIKRMVFMEWDDWNPNPRRNYQGFLFWQIANRSYYRGGDLRPYRVGGEFDEDYTSLLVQREYEYKVKDSLEKMAKEEALNLLNLSGGHLDDAYHTYFKRGFNQLKEELALGERKLMTLHPAEYGKYLSDEAVIQYKEYFIAYIEDRVQTTNTDIANKGDRILAYLAIKKEWESEHSKMLKILKSYHVQGLNIGIIELSRGIRFSSSIQVDDSRIVREILQNFSI